MFQTSVKTVTKAFINMQNCIKTKDFSHYRKFIEIMRIGFEDFLQYHCRKSSKIFLSSRTNVCGFEIEVANAKLNHRVFWPHRFSYLSSVFYEEITSPLYRVHQKRI